MSVKCVLNVSLFVLRQLIMDVAAGLKMPTT